MNYKYFYYRKNNHKLIHRQTERNNCFLTNNELNYFWQYVHFPNDYYTQKTQYNNELYKIIFIGMERVPIWPSQYLHLLNTKEKT